MLITKPKKANDDIRQAMIKHGVRQWQVADALGVGEVTLCKYLRRELNNEEKKEILNAIEKASA